MDIKMNKVRLHGFLRSLRSLRFRFVLGTRSLCMRTGLFMISLLLPVWALANTQAISWQSLASGIDYTHIPIKQALSMGKLHAFRIDLARNDLEVSLAKNLSDAQSLYIKQFAELTKGLVAINGGFFDPLKEPLGLRINNYETHSPVRNISWWGVFYITNNRPHIIGLHQFHAHRTIKMAIQAGPRLIINGTIPNLVGGTHLRSALCINPRREVLLFITEQAQMTTTELARILIQPEAEGGFACRDALNLDGGSSSQVYAQIADFKLYISNLGSVSDALVVRPKEYSRAAVVIPNDLQSNLSSISDGLLIPARE